MDGAQRRRSHRLGGCPEEDDGIQTPRNHPLDLWVAANRSWVPIQITEWVLKDSKGFYPCKDTVFTARYERADNEITFRVIHDDMEATLADWVEQGWLVAYTMLAPMAPHFGLGRSPGWRTTSCRPTSHMNCQCQIHL